MAPIVLFDHVTYTYPGSRVPALRDISLKVEPGSFLGVIGRNGAGKSTLCETLAGVIPHHLRGDLRGQVLVDGLDTSRALLSELAKHVGLVFQNPFNQLSGAKLTVAEEVAFGLENLGVPRTDMLMRVPAALQVVGLADMAERSPFELSGGEMQRLALASILVMDPRVLVLDEPTAQLDPAGTREVFAALRTIVDLRRKTVILVEQKVDWVAKFADRVLVMAEGALRLDGTPREILTSPRLSELGVTAPYFTRAARAAQEAGLWPIGHELPITLEQAVEGFQALSQAI